VSSLDPKKDLPLINRINNAKIHGEVSEEAQSLRALVGVNRYSPLSILQRVRKQREEGYIKSDGKLFKKKDLKKDLKAEKAKIKEEIKKNKKPIERDDWEGLVESLKCSKVNA
jgi:hypothetical protein